jgi:fructosamine-3-kinase
MRKGEPCLIDPAVYFGNREADLAMTRLFGGFSEEFYSAYEKHSLYHQALKDELIFITFIPCWYM